MSKFQKNCWSGFPLKSQKPQKRVFLEEKSGFREIGAKNQKSGRVTFEPLFDANFMPNLKKILGAVLAGSRNGRTDGRTDGHTE
ncbi:MAG: hypothetical protein GY775_19995 [Candidatus Scalindua sp.]|nr:hypothetical protein [Candidatus Scalindua sp.]